MNINIVQLVNRQICVYHSTKFDCCTTLLLDFSLDTRRYDAPLPSFLCSSYCTISYSSSMGPSALAPDALQP
jgi:hypothetical protein